MKVYAVLLLGSALAGIAFWLSQEKTDLESWMKNRRIDNKQDNLDICPNCGAPMKSKINYTGERKGIKAKVCSRYPTCNTVRWNQ